MASSKKGSFIGAEKRPEAQADNYERYQKAPAVHNEHSNTQRHQHHHHHHHHHHHQPSARILHHWVHQFEKINASLDEHGQIIGQEGNNRHGGRRSFSNGPQKYCETKNKSRGSRDDGAPGDPVATRGRKGGDEEEGNEEEDGEGEEEEDDDEDDDDDDELCFKASQLITELLLMLFAVSLLVIAAVVICSKNIPAFMKSYEIVPSFLFFMCIVVAVVSLTRWLVSQVRAKIITRFFYSGVPELIAEQKLTLPGGIIPLGGASVVGTQTRLVESGTSRPSAVLVTVSNLRATVSDNQVSSAPTSMGAAATARPANYANWSTGGGGYNNGTNNGCVYRTTTGSTTTSSGYSSSTANGNGNGNGNGNTRKSHLPAEDVSASSNSSNSAPSPTVGSYKERKGCHSLTKSNLISDAMSNTIDEESNSSSLTELA